MIKRNAISSHVKDIEHVISNHHEHKIQQLLTSRLNQLLSHACDTTKFYANYKNFKVIGSFPVINKTLVKENLPEFLSEKYSDTSKLIPMITSGSTGTPFKIFHDKNKRVRNWADTIYFGNKAGYIVGEKLYYFKIWSAYNQKSRLQEFMQHIVPVDVLNLEKNCSSIIRKINEDKVNFHFLGYASAFETLCKFLDKNPDLKTNIQVKSIITMSESLDEYTKTTGEKYFTCPVLSRYSNIENGILAQQTKENEVDFLVNTASYLIEIFDLYYDKPLPNGAMGRIIVTDYFNYASPMIRYDTGDVGALEEKVINGKLNLYLTKIEGRKLDQIFNTSGDLISSYIVYKNMWKYTEIDQYQLIQQSVKEYTIKICASSYFAREEELKNEFIEYLGSDAIFKIEYVAEIPLLSSGKRKKVMNLMKN